MIVYGVREDGYREILGVEVADTESEATYQELFRGLKGRGLRGVRLVTSDDHPGLEAAISRHFQGASWQRCQFHYSKNLLKMVGSKKRAELAEGLREVFACPTRETALAVAGEMADQWRESHPKVAEHVEEHIEKSASPASHFRPLTERGYAPPMAWRGSTRR